MEITIILMKIKDFSLAMPHGKYQIGCLYYQLPCKCQNPPLYNFVCCHGYQIQEFRLIIGFCYHGNYSFP